MADSRYYPSLMGVWLAAWLIIWLVTGSWIAAPAASGVMLAAAWPLARGRGH